MGGEIGNLASPQSAQSSNKRDCVSMRLFGNKKVRASSYFSFLKSREKSFAFLFC